MSTTTPDAPGSPRAIDMSQFHRVFFEEAAEHLADMENLLVRVDVAAPASEELNAIFRAAHSIKGGSGTFGFHEMAQVTHELESLLDKVRNGDLALRGDMVDVLLEASDLLKAQLAHYRGEDDAPMTPVDAMCQKIRDCMSRSAEDRAVAPMPAATSPKRTLEIRFVPAPAATLDNLLAQLALLGELHDVTPALASAGGVGGEQPVQLLRLTTSATNDEVLSLFAWVIDPETVRITTCDPQQAPAIVDEDVGFGFFDDAPGAPGASSRADGDDPGYGFFDAAPGAPTGTPTERRTNPGRRASDQPGYEGRAGKRESDRVVGAVDSSIRVGIDKVDQLINLVGELVITQAMLAQNAASVDPVVHEKLLNGLAQLDRNTRDLQEAVMSVRMMPIAVVFNRFPRVVRDLAAKLAKQVELKTEGEGTELDKGLIEKITDPLTHLVRNSLDHGIESVEQRLAAGKPAKGTVTLRAFHRGGNIVIEVADDGAGLNRERILAKAKERGMAVHDGMSDQEVWQLIFEAGFSTAAVVTDVSGRGVGMDVVRRNIRELGGRVEIESVAGVGSRVSIRLPLTLAILDGMSIEVGGETFILPLNHIVESLQVSADDVRTIAGTARVISVRGEYVPVVALQEVLGLERQAARFGHAVMVILESDGANTALLVDELLGQHRL